MKTAFAAAGVLALAGSALAAPFQATAFALAAEGDFTAGALFGGGLSVQSQATDGVLWTAGGLLASNASSPEVQGSLLLGLNPGGNAPTTDAPEFTSGGLILGIPVDAWTGPGDTSFDVNYGAVQNRAISSAFNAITGGNEIWVGQLAVVAGSAAPTINSLLIGDSNNPGPSGDFTSGSGIYEDGQLLFAELRLRGTVQNFNGEADVYDLVITDIPAPGAAALLGLAGVAGVRRRRA